MLYFIIFIIIFIVVPVKSFSVSHINTFKVSKPSFKLLPLHSTSSTWQEKLDEFVDIDTSFNSKRKLAGELLFSLKDVTSDVFSAIKDRDFEKLAPSSLTYGRNIKNAASFRKQLITDIIPDLVFNKAPKLIKGTPSLLKKMTQVDTGLLRQQGTELLKFARELIRDPSLLQGIASDMRKEIKNIFKSTPEGVYTPPYQVLKAYPSYEIRQYESYSVVSTQMSPETGNEDEVEPLSIVNSCIELVKYMFGGDNDGNQKLPMTAPIILGNGKLEIVLPNRLTSTSAPKPNSPKLSIEDIRSETVAVLQFSGFATEREVARQRALLEDALLAEGIVYDNLSFKTLTYNPPYTLPWVRRNEVSLKVEYKKPRVV